jgi:hypothetical protein
VVVVDVDEDDDGGNKGVDVVGLLVVVLKNVDDKLFGSDEKVESEVVAVFVIVNETGGGDDDDGDDDDGNDVDGDDVDGDDVDGDDVDGDDVDGGDDVNGEEDGVFVVAFVSIIFFVVVVVVSFLLETK